MIDVKSKNDMIYKLESPKDQKLSIEDYALICSILYKDSGKSLEVLAEIIGLNIDKILNHDIKLKNLEPELKKLVKEGSLDSKLALFVHRAFHNVD